MSLIDELNQTWKILFLSHNVSSGRRKMLKSGKMVCLYIRIAFFILSTQLRDKITYDRLFFEPLGSGTFQLNNAIWWI